MMSVDVICTCVTGYFTPMFTGRTIVLSLETEICMFVFRIQPTKKLQSRLHFASDLLIINNLNANKVPLR